MHHSVLDRNLIREASKRLLSATVQLSKGETYEDRYRRLLDSYDNESHLERKFLDHLYENRLALPDIAQKRFKGLYVVPDFYYEDFRTCVFIDGSVHDAPQVKESDESKRQVLKDHGYDVISLHYMDDMASFVETHKYLFKKIEA
jgi:very-short-patch-repair endonuclease